jgi:hypothetical protein
MLLGMMLAVVEAGRVDLSEDRLNSKRHKVVDAGIGCLLCSGDDVVVEVEVILW